MSDSDIGIRHIPKTTTSRSLGTNHPLVSDVTSDQFHNYEERLLPLLSRSYLTDTDDVLATPLPLSRALTAPLSTVAVLQVKPGERHFMLWFVISSYLPLVLACLAPLANLISFIGVIQHWRVESATNREVPDQNHLLALNVCSFVFGVIGNVFLLTNFNGAVRYLMSQSISIGSWLIATALLLADIVITSKDFGSKYSPSEGFWFGVFTTGLYFFCALLLVVNFLGYKLGKYPAKFNLDAKQRTLMVYTIVFVAWLVVGSVLVAHLIEDLSYGSSLYYCTVSILTIGLGDILPKTVGARVFVLILSFVGVLIMGLIIAMIRLVVLSSGGPTVFWHQVEKLRQKKIYQLEKNNAHLSSEQAFHEMRVIRRRSRIRQTNTSVLLSVFFFILFWLVGACVFKFTEDWSYFDAIYFCFLCLITIGYGDFAPKSPLGRVFFVSWAIAAVPLMTILISNVGDKLYDIADSLSYFTIRLFSPKKLQEFWNERARRVQQHEDLTEDEVDVDEVIEDEEIHSMEPAAETRPPLPQYAHPRAHHRMTAHKQELEKLLDGFNRLKPLISDSIGEPKKRYDHATWSDILREVYDPGFNPISSTEEAPPSVEQDPEFWLSARSPLRLPLNEPNYMILKVFFKLESDIKKLIDQEIRYIEELEKS